MAYDNVVLGNFHAVKMINRAILENLVCLDLIISNDELHSKIDNNANDTEDFGE